MLFRSVLQSSIWITRRRLFWGRDLIVRYSAVELRSRGRVGIDYLTSRSSKLCFQDMDELLVKTSSSRQRLLRWVSFLFLVVSYSFVQQGKNVSYLKTSASQAKIMQVGSFCMTARIYCLVFTYIKLIISLL